MRQQTVVRVWCYLPPVTLSYHLYEIGGSVPVWHIEGDRKPSEGDEPIVELWRNLQPVNDQSWITFRGKSLDRFSAVFRTGVDVTPTDDTIFCAELDKALEYAKPDYGQPGPGLIYALHGGCLERSFRVLPAEASPEEIAEVRRIYPHQYEGPFGQLRFSRLADQVNPAYQDAYGYWVPGNARDALLAIFILGQRSDVVDAITALVTSIAVDGALPTG